MFCLLLLFSVLTVQNFAYSTEDEVSTKTKRVYDAEDSSHIKQKHLVYLDLQISLLYKTKRGLCSGSVISDSWILSAGHCFKSDDEKALLNIRATVKRIEYNRWVTLGIVTKDNIVTHPKFVYTPDKPSSENDLALLKTTKALLHENLVPIKLYMRPITLGQITTATIAGYGNAELGLSDTDKPRQGVVTVSSCSEKLGHNLLCSYDLVRGANGDSGGSLVSKGGRLLGVTSTSCGDVHIPKRCMCVYVEVFYHLDWIKNVTSVNL